MNILYVGSLAVPIRDILTGKNEKEITGWPAFFFPVYKLIMQGHQVDFVVTSDLSEYDISVDWFKADQIVENIIIDDNKRRKYGVISKLYYRIYEDLKFISSVKRAVKKKHYDFIYCQEITGVWGNWVANKKKIPCGVRIYGDAFAYRGKIHTKYEYILEHGVLGLFIAVPKMLLLYKLKKSFMLTTADGTHGDLTYKTLKPKKDKYDFYYWKTGVNKNLPMEDVCLENSLKDIQFIAYPARIDTIKRQELAIEVLKLLHDKGYKIHLYLIGHICNDEYYKALVDIIEKNNLSDYIHFTGGVTQNQVKVYSVRSIATILTGELSNRGNVFFELFSVGVPIVAFNDGSLNDYIENEKSGFLVNNTEEMSNCVIKMISDPHYRAFISTNALMVADEKVLSESMRFDMEIELIKKYIGNSIDKDLPNRL